MTNSDTRTLDLIDATPTVDSGGCGCGGCGSATDAAPHRCDGDSDD